jgi:hypothetical protein
VATSVPLPGPIPRDGHGNAKNGIADALHDPNSSVNRSALFVASEGTAGIKAITPGPRAPRCFVTTPLWGKGRCIPCPLFLPELHPSFESPQRAQVRGWACVGV